MTAADPLDLELDTLAARLGPFGFQWLCACAVLPALRYPVTLALGRALAGAAGRPEPDAEEHRALFLHPWFREGFIPRATRAVLVRRLDPALKPMVLATVEDVLAQAGEAADLTPDCRSALARILAPRREEDEGDGILVSTLCGLPPPDDGLSLGGDLARRLNLSPFRDPVVAGCLTLATLALAAALTLALRVLPGLSPFAPELASVLTPAPAVTPDSFTARQAARAAAAATDWRPVLTLRGHAGQVNTAVVSPDGTRVLTGALDNTARIWDAATGEEVRLLADHTGMVWGADWSPDGQLVVVASDDGTATVHEATGGSTLATLTGHKGGILHATFSRVVETRQEWFGPGPVYRVVTAGADGTARVWEVAETGLSRTSARLWSAQGILTLPQGSGIQTAHFSPDGTRILLASWDGTASIWDAVKGDMILPLKGPTDLVASAEWSPDGQRVLTTSNDTTANLWDARDGSILGTLRPRVSKMTSGTFSPDGGSILLGSASGSATLWQATKSGDSIALEAGQFATSPNTFVQVATLTAHTGIIADARFSPDGVRIVTASSDGTAILWAPVVSPAALAGALEVPAAY